MELHLNASDIDLLKIAALVAAFLLNRQALIILAYMLVGEVVFYFTDSGFMCSLLLAALYSTNACTNITLKSQIRHVLLCIGLLNWLAAVDYLVAPDTETYFYICYPWLVNALDLLILYHLFGNWRPQNVGAMGILGKPFNRSALRL